MVAHEDEPGYATSADSRCAVSLAGRNDEFKAVAIPFECGALREQYPKYRRVDKATAGTVNQDDSAKRQQGFLEDASRCEIMLAVDEHNRDLWQAP